MKVLIDCENDKIAFIKKSLEDFEEPILNDDSPNIPILYIVNKDIIMGIVLYHTYDKSWIFINRGYFEDWEYDETSLFSLYLRLLDKSQTFKIMYETF